MNADSCLIGGNFSLESLEESCCAITSVDPTLYQSFLVRDSVDPELIVEIVMIRVMNSAFI